MNFVVATLLVNLDYSEQDAFWMFLAILNNFHFKHLFSPEVPLLPLRMFHFSRLVRDHLPNVWHHLNAKTYSGIEIFANQWIMTLFAYYLEPEVLGRVWDLFFLQGWKYIFQFGLSILKLLENDLCKMDVEEISAFMASSRNGNSNKSVVAHPFTNPQLLEQQILFSLDAFHITNGQLEALSRQFLNQKLVQVLHELPSSVWEEKQAMVAVPTVSLDDTAESPFVIKRAKTGGFWWVFAKESDVCPSYMQIDLFALDTPNRPREKLPTTQPRIWLPLKSLHEIRDSTSYVDSVHQKTANTWAAELEVIEKDLVFETHVMNQLQLSAMKTEEALKEAAKHKYLASKSLKMAMSPGKVSESSEPSKPLTSAVTDLLKRATSADMLFLDRKEERDGILMHIRSAQNKINELTRNKNENIRKITHSFSQLEDTQNDIISRSIQSAIASFSSKV